MVGSASLRRWLPLLALVVAVAVVVGIVSASQSDSSQEARSLPPPRPDVFMRLGAPAHGPPVAPGFVGLSFEFPAVAAYTGADPHAVDPVLVQLIRNIAPGQSPVLRIGGDSTDVTWWPTSGFQKPPGVTYSLSPAWLASTAALAQATNARLILGIDLKENQPPLAQSEASAMLRTIGKAHILALEIGNEPALYGQFPWYHSSPGHPVYARPRGYGFGDFTAEFSKYARVLPDVRLAGPTAGSFSELASLGRFIAAEPKLGVVTYHRYPLNRCFTHPGSTDYPTIANLLAARATTRLARGVKQYVALAHRHNLQFRIDELNSVACGGKRGISNTFASSLWIIDALFAMARAGVDGVNIHMFPGARYALFDISRGGGQWAGTARPEYYGVLTFERAAPAGARLLRVSRSPGQAELHAWATRSPDGKVRVALINDSTRRWRVVGVRIPPSSGAATVERLRGPGLRATTGVTLGGQSFAPGGDGELAAESTTPVAAARGRYVIPMPPASAAVVTIKPR